MICLVLFITECKKLEKMWKVQNGDLKTHKIINFLPLQRQSSLVVKMLKSFFDTRIYKQIYFELSKSFFPVFYKSKTLFQNPNLNVKFKNLN